MAIVVFDLEWNMGYPKTPDRRLNEIIEIGAVKLDSFSGGITDSFREFVRPTVHHTLHHYVRKKLPFGEEELKHAARFPTVSEQFRIWCGPQVQFVSWGPSDAAALRENLDYFRLDGSWARDAYDLQAAYGFLTGDVNRQTALNEACAEFGVEAEGEFHDAGTDARCTALVGIAMQKRYGKLPAGTAILRKKEELRAQKEKEAEEKLGRQWDDLLRNAPRYEEAVFGNYAKPGEYLQDRVINRVLCPECARSLGCGKWIHIPGGYLSRASCPEHGKFYPVIQIDGKAEKQGEFAVRRFVIGQSPQMKTVYFRSLEKARPKKAKRGD